MQRKDSQLISGILVWRGGPEAVGVRKWLQRLITKKEK